MAKHYSVKCSDGAEHYYHQKQPRNDTGPARSAFKKAAKLQYHADDGADVDDIRLTNFQSNLSQPHEGSTEI